MHRATPERWRTRRIPLIPRIMVVGLSSLGRKPSETGAVNPQMTAGLENE